MGDVMKKILLCLFCLVPIAANAEITYRVQKTWEARGEDAARDVYASKHRFYAGAMYNFSIWQDYTSDDNITAKGKDTSGFDVLLGIRWFDTFRIEADYFTTRARWNSISVDTNTAFLNLIVDARIDSLYRMFYKQKLIPYIGAGVGATWTNGKDTVVNNDTVASFAVLAGLGIEFNDWFTLDIGYRYMYVSKPGIEGFRDLAPNANQVRVGARINF